MASGVLAADGAAVKARRDSKYATHMLGIRPLPSSDEAHSLDARPLPSRTPTHPTRDPLGVSGPLGLYACSDRSSLCSPLCSLRQVNAELARQLAGVASKSQLRALPSLVFELPALALLDLFECAELQVKYKV